MRIPRLPILTTLIAAAFSLVASYPVVADQSQVHLECEDIEYGKSFLSLDIDYSKSSVTEKHDKYVNSYSAKITDDSVEWTAPPPPWRINFVLNRYSGQLAIRTMDDARGGRLSSSCLSGCFSKPLAVVVSPQMAARSGRMHPVSPRI